MLMATFSRPVPALPNELFGIIADFLQDDKAALGAAVLSSARFHRARVHLWREVTFLPRYPYRIKAFQEILPGVQAYIKVLHIDHLNDQWPEYVDGDDYYEEDTGDEQDNGNKIADNFGDDESDDYVRVSHLQSMRLLSETIPLMPSLEEVDIRRLFYEDELYYNRAIFAESNIRILRLHDILFDRFDQFTSLLAQFPHLRSLQLTDLVHDEDYNDSSAIVNVRGEFPLLRSLSIRACTFFVEALEWFSQPSTPQFQSLDFYYPFHKDARILRNFLQPVTSTLTDLRIRFYKIEEEDGREGLDAMPSLVASMSKLEYLTFCGEMEANSFDWIVNILASLNMTSLKDVTWEWDNPVPFPPWNKPVILKVPWSAPTILLWYKHISTGLKTRGMLRLYKILQKCNEKWKLEETQAKSGF